MIYFTLYPFLSFPLTLVYPFLLLYRKMSFGKFLEISFYNHSAYCRVEGCYHSLRDDHILSFYCDSYEVSFIFVPTHPFSLHVRNHMIFPHDFHLANTALLLQELPFTHATLIQDFQMALVVLEQELHDMLAGRPQECALAIADLDIIEAELASSAKSFIEFLQFTYDALPPVYQDHEFRHYLQGLRENQSKGFQALSRSSKEKEYYHASGSMSMSVTAAPAPDIAADITYASVTRSDNNSNTTTTATATAEAVQLEAVSASAVSGGANAFFSYILFFFSFLLFLYSFLFLFYFIFFFSLGPSNAESVGAPGPGTGTGIDGVIIYI